jgi:uncharacterized membrane protein YfcA
VQVSPARGALVRQAPARHCPAALPTRLGSQPVLASIHEPIFYAAAIPAVILMGLSKGGFSGLGLLAITLMSLVVSPVRAAAIMLPILIVQDVVTVWAYRNAFDKKLLAIMLPGSVIGIAIGWLVATAVSEAFVRVAVGLISVCFVGVWVYRQRRSTVAEARQATVGGGVFWGAVAGYTSFVAHAGGPPFQVHVLPLRLSPVMYAGTNAVFFAVTNAIKVIPYVALGQFSPENLGTSAMLFPVAIVSTFLGVWLVRQVDANRFYGIIYALTFVVGVKLIWDGVRDLL